MLQYKKIAVIGLGYVGLPLAIEFAKKYGVVGFDIDSKRIDELKNGIDQTQEANLAELHEACTQTDDGSGLLLSSELNDLKNANIYIVTVPTPIDKDKKPNLKPLLDASEMIGCILKRNDIVIYESTVYPGCTEEDCVPVLEAHSGLRYNLDFFCGYSPERINPGDKVNTLTKIKKVTSGSSPEVAQMVDQLYGSIITAGTHLAPSIKVAEASKAIENAQRDINISFVNELALMFDKMGIDTSDVLQAASTKWNFLDFKPGLVGGHCIGVDPYYLLFKSELLGYHPQVILSGRRVNDQMGLFVAKKVLNLLTDKGKSTENARVLILGFTFKENCPDTRNTQVVDIYRELKSCGAKVIVHDPWADKDRVKSEFGIELSDIGTFKYDIVVLAVSHKQFDDLDFKGLKEAGAIIFDAKGTINRDLVDSRL